MIFRHDGKAYPDAHLEAYRTADLDLLVVTAPPDHRFVFVNTCDGVRALAADEIAALAGQLGLDGLVELSAAEVAA